MHGPTRICWANLTPFSLQRALAAKVPAEAVQHGVRARFSHAPALVDAVVAAEMQPIPAVEAARQRDTEAMNAAPLAAPSTSDPFDFLASGLEVLVLPERQSQSGAASQETLAEQHREAFRAVVTPTAPAPRSTGDT